MKAKLIGIDGKQGKEIELPKCFSSKIREDIVAKVIEAKKTTQPYGPSPVAGMQQSDRGKINHRRHVWQTHYGRGMSRIPRKVMSRRGTQFNWVGSGIPFARGGPRAHPPKVIAMQNHNKINKKELLVAMNSAISATADKTLIAKRYSRVEEKDLKYSPMIIESSIVELKAKDILKMINEIFGKDLKEVVVKSKTQRAGKGKLRGRKYKSNAGMLLVLGDKEQLKTNMFDVVNAKELCVEDLAKGGLGRITMFSEGAVKLLGRKK